jgi:hypothetical protein
MVVLPAHELLVLALGLFSVTQVAKAQDLGGLPLCAQSCTLHTISSTGCRLYVHTFDASPYLSFSQHGL